MGNAANLNNNEGITLMLEKVFSNVNSWLTFAEAKNGSIVALNGVIITGLVSLLLNTSYSGNWLTCLCIVIVFLGIGMVISLLSFWPNTKSFNGEKIDPIENTKLNLLFFRDIAQFKCSKQYIAEIYEKYFGESASLEVVSKIHLDYATEILINSKIAVKKYQYFKLALLSNLVALSIPALRIVYQILSIIFH